MTNFVSLHNQTDYSILDSLISPKALFQRAKELGQSAVAITDHGTLASVWDALKASRETGVKLIVGCECYFVDDASKSEDKFRHIILIAKNAIGYKNLLTINKKGFDQGKFLGKRIYPVIDWNLLEKYKDGLICLTACGNGIVSALLTNGKFDEADRTILRLKDLFGDNLGLEIQPNNMQRFASIFNEKIDQGFLNRQIINLGKKHNIKVVPACNAHYLKKEDSATHDVFLSIGSHQPVYSNFRLKYPLPEFYLKSGDEVKNFFSRNWGEEYAEELCANTIYFSDLCEFPDWIDPKYSNPSGKELPIFPVKDEPDYSEFCEWLSSQDDTVKSLAEDKQFLRFKCLYYFNSRIKDLNDGNRKQYEDRLVEELDVIEFHGFSSYMLIVADFIDWARKNDIFVGEGRGSVGGSLIGFLLGIHQADPIKYNLIFARFHNKEKSSFPDIDTDFAPSGRVRVQDYLRKKYGEEHVAHVSNVNTITPKVYVRDISRSCELGGSKEEAVRIGNDVADCIPADIHSIDDALQKIPLFAEYCKKYPEFIQYKDICGKYRAWSTHAGGIIISARPLTGLVPLRKDKDGALAIEYDKDKAEENGLVKMDTLGLSTLDIIGEAIKIIKQQGKEIPVEFFDYDVSDEATYKTICDGNTFGIFQLGTSGGTVDLCKRIKPHSINDLANINALARPSARDMRNDFIKTRDGEKSVTLLHPKLSRAFDDTYGFGLYEECLMYLAQDIAGWSLHSADRLRKLTKEKGKNPKKAQAWRTEFINDSVKNGINEVIAQRIWDEVISLFAGYGFNKSLSVFENVDVYTSDGKFLQSKPIGEVYSGEYVRSRDEMSNQDIFIQVKNRHDHGILPLVEIELETGEKVKCTMDHKFRTVEMAEMLPLWQILRNNLSIVISNYEYKKCITMTNIKSITFAGNYQTYDLEVDHPDHQYYLSNGILTSNSHAVLYSMTSYKTAYLKAHFPVEFLLANLMAEVKSNTPDAKGNIEKIKNELKNNKVKILPPDLNSSMLTYTILEDNKLLTGLDSLKFVGDDAIKDIIEKRPFKNFFDFMARVDSKKVRANTIQALASAGAMDSFKIPRKLIYLYCSDYRKKLQIWLKKHDPKVEEFVYPWPKELEWKISELYALEQFYLGESFVCKPPVAYGSFFKADHRIISDIKKAENKAKIAPIRVIVKDFFEFKVKKETSKYYGKSMIKAVVEDIKGDQISCTIFPDRWELVKKRIKDLNSKAEFEAGLALNMAANVNVYEDDVGIILDNLYDIAMNPSLPEDLKAKKINLKEAKVKLAQEAVSKLTTVDSLVEQIEDALYDEGLIDLSEDTDI